MMNCGFTPRWMLMHGSACRGSCGLNRMGIVRAFSMSACVRPCRQVSLANIPKLMRLLPQTLVTNCGLYDNYCSFHLGRRTLHSCGRTVNLSQPVCDKWTRNSTHILTNRIIDNVGSRYTQSFNALPHSSNHVIKSPKCLHLSAFNSQQDGNADAGDDKKKQLPKMRENVLTIPNLLTMSRFVMTPVLCYMIVSQSYSWACGMFVLTGITDVLDGWIARHFPSQASAFGSFLDPLADKFLVISVFLTLTWVNLIPLPLAALVIARDVGLIAAAHYVRYISLTPPFTFLEFYDVTHPSAQLKPTTISKINTVVQLSLVAFTLAAPVFNFLDHPALHALWYLTAGTTIGSGLGYVFMKDTFKLNRAIHKRP